MRKYSSILGGVLIALLLIPAQVIAAIYFVDSLNGDDADTGLSETNAFRSVSRTNQLALSPGDSILFRRGQSFDGVLDLASDGTNALPIRIGAWNTGEKPTLYELYVTGDYQIVENINIDHRQDASDAVRLRGARNCVLRNMNLSNGTRDAIDIDQSDGLLVENVEIHHFLNGQYGSKDDSHGIAITNTDGVTIRGANIHHVSGDSVQADPNRTPGGISNNIVIENSELWTSPLQQDFNSGWLAGHSPGENALDTKVLTSGFENEIRMNVTLRNVTAHGWTAVPEISNRAVFNLKEKINAVLDGITIYDAEIALRVRGSLGNAKTTVANTVIYDVGTAIRAEDDVAELRVYHSTFGHNVDDHLVHAGGNAGVPSWDWRNNAFVGNKPPEASDATNKIAVNSDFIDVDSKNYHLSPTSQLIDVGDVIADVLLDRDAIARSAPYDAGAYELASDSAPRPNPPILLTE